MIVAKISAEIAESLKGKTYLNGVKYNPLQDINGDWIISLNELQYTEELLAEVELIKYQPKVDTKPE